MRIICIDSTKETRRPELAGFASMHIEVSICFAYLCQIPHLLFLLILQHGVWPIHFSQSITAPRFLSKPDVRYSLPKHFDFKAVP